MLYKYKIVKDEEEGARWSAIIAGSVIRGAWVAPTISLVGVTLGCSWQVVFQAKFYR